MNLYTTSLTNENKILLSTCRSDDISEIKDIIEIINHNKIDWDNLFSKAKYHKVLPFVYHNLTKHLHNLVAENVLEKFRQEYVDNSKKSLFLSSVLIELLRDLDKSGVRAISLKGPALSYHLHDDITLRDFTDLDILIKKDDLDRTYVLMKSSGYIAQFELSGQLKEYYENSHYYYHNFIRNDNKVVVDVHWATSAPNYSFSRDFNYYEKRLNYINFLDNRVSILRNEDLLLLLCIHGCKHLWAQLKWICDIADLCQSNQKVDIEYVVEQSQEFKCTKMLYSGLYIADLLFDCIPPSFVENVRKSVINFKIRKEFFYGIIFPDQYAIPSKVQQYLFFPFVMDSYKDKFLYFYNNYLCPTPLEFSIIRLGSKFFVLYYFLRIFRLFFRLINRLIIN